MGLLDKTEIWLDDHGFKYISPIMDRTENGRGGVRFALLSIYDKNVIITCSVGYLLNVKGYDCEILDRDKFITDQVFKKTGTREYISTLYVENNNSLYVVDEMLDFQKEMYVKQNGNKISMANGYENRPAYQLPLNQNILTNFFTPRKKPKTEGEMYWDSLFKTFFENNPIKYGGDEFTYTQLSCNYGWAVDFTLYGSNGCIEEGYHTPQIKNIRERAAVEHQKKPYFIEKPLRFYKDRPDEVRKTMENIASTFGLTLNDDFYNVYGNSIDDFEVDD